MSEAIIRRAVVGEERKIAEMVIRLFDQHVEYDPDRFSNFVTPEGAANFYRSRIEFAEAEVLVAEIENEIVGFAYLEFESINYEELIEKAVWLHDIYLEPSARSSGAGKKLMQASIEAAKQLGGAKLLLGTAAKNIAAQRFFKSFGFSTTMIEMTLNLDT